METTGLIPDSLSSIRGLLTALVLLSGAFFIAKILYNIFFHPLRKYPGPLLCRASRLHYVFHQLGGSLPYKQKEWHDVYGEVVRIAPDELCYNSPRAVDEIQVWRSSKYKGGMEKDKTWYSQSLVPIPVIVTAESEDHSRLRRILSHAFSNQALARQEPLIQHHVSKFIRNIAAEASSSRRPGGGGAVNLVPWYGSATLDIICDLSFGTTLQCLDTTDSSSMHPWVAMITGHMKQGLWVQAWRRLPALVSRSRPAELALALLGSQWKEQFMITQDMARKRVAGGGSDREDFISHMHRANDDKGMTLPEMEISASIFMTAGSDTSASLLMGTTFYVCRAPDLLARLTGEVRGTFDTEEAMTFDALAKLPFLNAALEEGLRLYQPIPTTFSREVPEEGASISGRWVPGGYKVGVNPYSAAMCEKNYHRAEEFIPERWMEGSVGSEDQKKAHRPFSAGPRDCIGKNLAYAETRALLARLVWAFDISLAEDSLNWDKNQKIFISRQKPPLNVRLTPVKKLMP